MLHIGLFKVNNMQVFQCLEWVILSYFYETADFSNRLTFALQLESFILLGCLLLGLFYL